MKEDFHLHRSKYGFIEIAPKPSGEELRRYYQDQYFRRVAERNTAKYEYSDAEISHRAIAAEEASRMIPANAKSILEIGVGEGDFLGYFCERGFDVFGVDLADHGATERFPCLRGKIWFGDLYEFMEKSSTETPDRFDVIACNHVLEHVVDPIAMLRQLRKRLNIGGICRISVPNDNSWLQNTLVEMRKAEPNYWVVFPDHLNYFNAQSLKTTVEAAGWRIEELLADFPIEMFLFNNDTNYQTARSRGRNCHFARVDFELALFRRDLESLIKFRKACAEIGIGRSLTVYLR